MKSQEIINITYKNILKENYKLTDIFLKVCIKCFINDHIKFLEYDNKIYGSNELLFNDYTNYFKNIFNSDYKNFLMILLKYSKNDIFKLHNKIIFEMKNELYKLSNWHIRIYIYTLDNYDKYFIKKK